MNNICICICILNYNNGLKTVHCLKSIFAQIVDNWNIVLIDNASTDDSISIIKSYLEDASSYDYFVSAVAEYEAITSSSPKILFLLNPMNVGYSAGNNIGIHYARAHSEFTHFLIINNDIALPSDFLEKISAEYSILKSLNKSNLALGVTEYNKQGKVTHRGFHYLHLLSALAFDKPLFPCFKYIVGSCIFLDNPAPLMDESYFLYFDDVQYSKILLAAKYHLDSIGSVGYIHDVGYLTTKSTTTDRIIFHSMKIFYQKNYPSIYPFVVFIRVLLNIIIGRFRTALMLLKISVT
ncbi:MAG: glycosyltransferase [Bacteroidetes bacterium]|nr:glycosyltransferase [Bacteroidota bacterium]